MLIKGLSGASDISNLWFQLDKCAIFIASLWMLRLVVVVICD